MRFRPFAGALAAAAMLAGQCAFSFPDNPAAEALWESGKTEKREQRYEKAIGTFLEIEKMGIRDPEVDYYLAWSYIKKHPRNTQRAIEEFYDCIQHGAEGEMLKESRNALKWLLAKYEPVRGCYIGAFIDNSTEERDVEAFENRTGKEHASYINYVAYGRKFPEEWAAKLKQHGAAAHIALEPNNGLSAVRRNSYLINWAKAAGQSGTPIFLRFASEMNGNWTAYSGKPSLYRKKFRIVHDVMEEFAPNVAMVWVPFSMPQSNILSYYPGDEYVDWAGINIYSVYCHDGNAERLSYREDPRDFLRYVYNRFAAKKPIFIGEFAATHNCSVYGDKTEFALEKMTDLYSSLERDFPRVKAISWFSYDANVIGVDNKYALRTNGEVRRTYGKLISSGHFLSDVVNLMEDDKLLNSSD